MKFEGLTECPFCGSKRYFTRCYIHNRKYEFETENAYCDVCNMYLGKVNGEVSEITERKIKENESKL